MWNAAAGGLKAMRQMLAALIEEKMIRPDPIIKTSQHHLSCDKKVKITVNRVTGRLSDRGLCSRGKIRERTTEQNVMDLEKKGMAKGQKDNPHPTCLK